MFPMESEDFYDSLDEGSQREKVSQTSEEKDDVIPFYDKNISRSEIELSGKSSMGSAFTTKKPKTRRIIGFGESKLKSVSYLGLFYARSGVDCGDREDVKSSRSLVGSSDSEISPNSYISCEEYDGNSFYLSQHSESCFDNHSTLRENPDLAIMVPRTDFKKTHFEQNQKYESTLVNKSTAVKRPYPKITSNKLPEMGRLGPEIPTDKLELLRKRQQYGRRVSLTYGIKMKEKKVLQTLKQEISNSKLCT